MKIIQGDSLQKLKELEVESIDCCITSPPYFGLRSYSGGDAEIGVEKTPEEYVQNLVNIYREVWRALKQEGTVWLNLGDSYNGNTSNKTGQNGYNDGRNNKNKRFSNGGINGLKPKDLIGIPWRVAFALQSDGWYLRQDIIWHKPNPMPESVTDRCTKAHEYVFLLTKSKKYYYDNKAIKENAKPDNGIRDRDNTKLNNTPGRSKMKGLKHNQYNKRNKRSVWTINTKPFKEAHFAVFPEKLIEPMVLAGCPKEGIVLDPFAGAGTTGVIAKKLNREFIGIELNPDYIKIAEERIKNTQSNLL